MRLAWDPNPSFTTMPVYKPDATPDYIAHCKQRFRALYADYAASLDRDFPMWHFEILTVAHPPHELAKLAQERRDKEGQS